MHSPTSPAPAEPAAPAAATRKRAQDRIDEMLDVADAQINASRSAAISMRSVGETASASRALVYTYFADLQHLLDAVLDRHVAWLRSAGLDAAAREGDLLSRGLACADLYLRHIATRGMALEIVLRDAAAANALRGEARRFRAGLYRRLATAAARELRMNAHEALVLVQLLLVIPADAGRLVYEGELSLDDARDLVALLVTSSLTSLRPRD